MGVIDDLAHAREAFERRAWVTAYDALSSRPGDLDGADFDRLAVAALLAGRENDAIQALHRAFQHHLDAQDPTAAAHSAYWLALALLQHGEPAVAGGWIARCRHLVDGAAADSREAGYLLTLELFQRIYTGRFDGCLELAEQMTALARSCGDADLLAHGLNARGRMLIYDGQVRTGLESLDEAMTSVVTGQVSPLVAGETYCSLIEACQEVWDWGRAAAWTTALSRWIDEQPELVRFTGQCAVHRGQIMRIHGALREAQEEYDRAVARYLADGQPAPAGLARAEAGDVLRILGRLDEAEESFSDAVAYGHEAQPGRALLWLARGRPEAARAAIRRLLVEPRGPVQRAGLLVGCGEVLLAVGEVEEADAVATELAALAEDFGSSALVAAGNRLRAAVLLAQGQPAEALAAARAALTGWQSLGAGYDAARTRLLLAQALEDLGDAATADAELQLARTALASLGVSSGTEPVPELPGGLTPRELEVLRLVATGRSNPDIAATLVLSEKTVARHLSNIFTKLGVGSRTAAAHFAFEHQLL